MAEHPPFDGTEFQIKVWNALKEIPRGEVRTYTEIAVQIGHPNSARAVANACGQNPYPPIVPCHRVVRKDGGLGGYSGLGGVDTKKDSFLLTKQLLPELNFWGFLKNSTISSSSSLASSMPATSSKVTLPCFSVSNFALDFPKPIAPPLPPPCIRFMK